MSKRTKKVGPVGRYGARYGVRAKTRIKNIELIQRKKQMCPECGHKSVKRVSTAIWECRKCGNKFAGGAYLPKSEAGLNAEKILRGEVDLSEIVPKVKGARREGAKQ